MARKIIIEISGGNIQEIYSTEKENEDIAVYVIDWDNIHAGEKELLSPYPIEQLDVIQMSNLIDHANSKICENDCEDWRL